MRHWTGKKNILYYSGLIIIHIFIISFIPLFINYDKHNKSKQLRINDNDIITENITKNIGEKLNDIKVDKMTIEDIAYYIFNDRKIKWNYDGLEDLFKVFNISEKNIISSRSIGNWNYRLLFDFIIIYDFESNQCKFTVYTFGDKPKIVRLHSINIEINDENYLNLFPYIEMEKYFKDDIFGKIYEANQGKDNIYYELRYMVKGNDTFGYSNLLFDNGLLKSITIYEYLP